MSVRTGVGGYAYELAGPTVTLPPGTYQLWVRGSAHHAGSFLIALDAETNATIASHSYGPGANGTGGWGLIFKLDRSRSVRFVVANNGGNAVWLINSIELGQAPDQVGDTIVRQGCAFAPLPPGRASPRGHHHGYRGPLVRSWTPRQLVRGWIPQSGARLTPGQGTAVVHTTASPYGYQLASPVVGVKGGRSVLEVDARVGSGGLELLVEVADGPVIAKRFYGLRLAAPSAGFGAMAIFRFGTSEGVQFVLRTPPDRFSRHRRSRRSFWREPSHQRTERKYLQPSIDVCHINARAIHPIDRASRGASRRSNPSLGRPDARVSRIVDQ